MRREVYTIAFEQASPQDVDKTNYLSPQQAYAKGVAEKFAQSQLTFVHLVDIPKFRCTRKTLLRHLNEQCAAVGVFVHVFGDEIYLRKGGGYGVRMQAQQQRHNRAARP